ncbi:hypothetical protein ACWC5I_10240 [Kitasatospora sp. NPDC001574]
MEQVIRGRMTGRERGRLLGLANEIGLDGKTLFNALKQNLGRATWSHVKRLKSDLEWVDGLGDPDKRPEGVASAKVADLAGEAEAQDAGTLKNYNEARRVALAPDPTGSPTSINARLRNRPTADTRPGHRQETCGSRSVHVWKTVPWFARIGRAPKAVPAAGLTPPLRGDEHTRGRPCAGTPHAGGQLRSVGCGGVDRVVRSTRARMANGPVLSPGVRRVLDGSVPRRHRLTSTTPSPTAGRPSDSCRGPIHTAETADSVQPKMEERYV